MRMAIAALFLTASAAFAATPLPLDLAYSRRDVWRAMQPSVSADGRYVAYEIRTPPQRTVNGEGEAEALFLPNGFPTFFNGVTLWVSDTETGQSRPLCATGPCWRGSWSPSSKQLAFYSAEGGGAPGVWLYDVATSQSHRLGTAAIKARVPFGDRAAWSADGKTLYVLLSPVTAPVTGSRSREVAGSQSAVTVLRTRTKAAAPTDASDVNAFLFERALCSIAAIDVATGKARVLVPQDADPRPNLLRLSPDGRWLSYLSTFRVKDASSGEFTFDLAVVPSGGGKPVVIARDIELPADENVDAIYRWTNDSRRIVFVKDDALWMTDVVPNATPQRLGVSLGKILASPLQMTNEGVVVSLASKGGDVFDLGMPHPTALVPLDGSAPRAFDVVGVPLGWQPTPQSIALLRTREDAIEREIVAVDLTSGKTTRLWSGAGRFTVAGPARGGLVARFEGPATPPDMYLFDAKLNVVRRLSHVEPRLDGLEVGGAESIETVLAGPDGKMMTVQSRVLLPPGAKRGDALPAVIYFYSGVSFAGYAHDYAGGTPSAIPMQVFTSRGYAVLLCDVPLGPPGKPGNPAQEMTDAITAQARHAADLGYIDIRRVALLGHSYGAYSVAAIITRTNLFRAAIALDGVYDLAGNYGVGGAADVIWAEGGQGRMGTHPWADLARYLANSPYYQADKIHTPLLLAHGEKDGACPVVEAKKMFNALKRLDREAELAIYAGEGHVPGRWALANAVDVTQRTLDFLGQYVRAP